MAPTEKELNELKGFVADLKADSAAQKEKEQRESWTKYTSMSIVCIAVLAAIATQWAAKYSGKILVELNNSTYHQALASDKWSYYQANSIKQNLYETVHDFRPKNPGNGGVETARSEEVFNARINKYVGAKDQAFKEAKELETQRDQSRIAATESTKRGSAMGFSASIFQIAIALGSICLVTKKKPLWFLSLLLAAFATLRMVQVWLS
jgi:hypothetical protein